MRPSRPVAILGSTGSIGRNVLHVINELIDGYETLENLFSHLGELPSRTATALEAGHDAAFLFREISTIVNSLDLPLNANALPDPRITPDSKVRDLLEEVGYGRPETDSHDGTPGGIRTPDL